MSEFAQVPARDLKRRYGLKGFIETGTSAGGLAVRTAVGLSFERIASCEINHEWAEEAKRWYNQPGGNILIFEGASKICLPLMVRFVGDLPTLFWLDAHLPPNPEIYTDEEVMPLKDELQILVNKPGIEKDVIAIDDLRLFDLPTRPKQWNFPILITRPEIEALFPHHRAMVVPTPDVILILHPKREEP